MKKIVRKNFVVVNVFFLLVLILSFCIWLIFCLFNKDAFAQSYIILLVLGGTIISSDIIISTIIWVSKKDRIEFYDDKIIVFREKKPYEFAWMDIQDIKLSKFSWNGWDLYIMAPLCYLALRPFCVNVQLFIANEYLDNTIEFNISKSSAKIIQSHFNRTKGITFNNN